MSRKFNVLFPIEILHRELDYRLWLGVLTARPGNRVLIGFHEALYRIALRMHGGVYMGKNLFLNQFPTDLARYERLKRNGFSLLHLDDEGQVGGDREDLWRRMLELRLDARCLQADDYICTWGDFQRDHFRSVRPDLAPQIRTTGHPRFDLYKPAYRAYFAPDVERLRRRFGDFVLINTNMATANCGLGAAYPFAYFTDTGYNSFGYSLADPDSRLNHFRGWAHQTHMVAALVSLVNSLSLAFPETAFVVRPHPGEDWSLYEKIFRGLANIHVVQEGPVAPWLLATRLLIQENCTTSLEAHLAETPTVNYQPFASGQAWKNSFWMATLFGQRLTTEAEVADAVRGALAGNGGARPWCDVDPRVPPLMENFRSDAVEKCVAVLEEMEGRAGGEPHGPSSRRIATEQMRRRAEFAAKAVIRPLFRWKHEQYKFFTTKIFAGFEQEALRARLGVIESMTGKSVRLTFFSPELIALESA